MKNVGTPNLVFRALVAPALMVATMPVLAGNGGFDPVSQIRVVQATTSTIRTTTTSEGEVRDPPIYDINQQSTQPGYFGVFNQTVTSSEFGSTTTSQHSSFSSGLIRYDGSVSAQADPESGGVTYYTNSARGDSIFYGSFRFAKPHDVVLSINSLVSGVSNFDFSLSRGNGVVSKTAIGFGTGITSASFTQLLHLTPGTYSFGSILVARSGQPNGEFKATGDANWSLSVAAVPEPSTVALMGIGLAVLGGRALRDKWRPKRKAM